jgi:hypothetical protein
MWRLHQFKPGLSNPHKCHCLVATSPTLDDCVVSKIGHMIVNNQVVDRRSFSQNNVAPGDVQIHLLNNYWT